MPGPREDWRSEEPAGGTERWPFRRRRLEGSVEEERPWLAVAGEAVGAVTVEGEECRDAVVGWTSRWRGLLAMVVDGAALPGG